MIYTIQRAEVINLRKLRFVNKLISSMYCYFSAESSSFIKNARTLEKLKTGPIFPETVYQQGKYILFLKSELICIESNGKLLWKDFEGLPKLENEDVKPVTVILDVVTDKCQSKEICLFAVDFLDASKAEISHLESETGGKFVAARQLLFTLNEQESSYVSQARGLISFCRTTKYCSHCGGELTNKSAANQKKCEKCNKIHYPNVAPVGITLIENQNHSQVLLVRQSRHPPGMYSCVAGFVEAGESLEGNIRREIAEEVGLEVDNIEYCASQHWAMPASQLMLGCIATAKSKNFEIDTDELEDAQWVSAEQLRDAVNRVEKSKSMADVNERVLWVPPPSAVAHHLMAAWLQKHHDYVPSTPSRM